MQIILSRDDESCNSIAAAESIELAQKQDQLDTPALSPEERQQAREREDPSVLVIHEVVRKQGDDELARPASALAWSGLAAGLLMGASVFVQALLYAHLPDAPWRPLIVALGYPLGYMLVVIGRQQLFTENTLTPILPLMARRDLDTLRRVVKLWAVVLLANMAGAHLISWALAAATPFEHAVQQAIGEIAREAIAVSFGGAIVKGIFAGWLIASMVWMLAGVRSGHIAIIFLATYPVGLGGLTHIIAGSIDALFLVWMGELNWFRFASGYALPALIGNVLGGVSLVAAVNHAQVVAGRD